MRNWSKDAWNNYFKVILHFFKIGVQTSTLKLATSVLREREFYVFNDRLKRKMMRAMQEQGWILSASLIIFQERKFSLIHTNCLSSWLGSSVFPVCQPFRNNWYYFTDLAVGDDLLKFVFIIETFLARLLSTYIRSHKFEISYCTRPWNHGIWLTLPFLDSFICRDNSCGAYIVP